MAKNPEGRFDEDLRKIVDDEVQRRVSQQTHKLKRQVQTAKQEKDEAIKAADNLRRQAKTEKERAETAEASLADNGKELARARITIRSLQDQGIEQEKAASSG